VTDIVDDGYDDYYAARLWQLMPGVYRAEDTDSLTEPGPLRELLNRIATQVAVVRRSIDRLWADQSIETCDDWVVPYIGDLLGTNLVNNLDPAGQRLDVAKTIHYRRRKGTLPVLEELALDITGWPAHVVESFRRLARTRHGLDPAVGAGGYPQSDPTELSALLQVEGLQGLLTGGLAGGFADLRSPHCAGLAGSAFDESFHTADMRVGQGALGHFGIPKLLVFLWRLTSFQIGSGPTGPGDPVAVAGCPGQWVFDPTGREIPLFLPMPAPTDDFADTWTPAHEWDVPGPITTSFWEAASPPVPPAVPPPPTVPPQIPAPPPVPYPDTDLPQLFALNGGAKLSRLWPELGRFGVKAGAPAAFTVAYQYAFSSTVGAGSYDRAVLGDPPQPVGDDTVVKGGSGLGTALADLSATRPLTGTVTVGDSRTYQDVHDVGSSADPIVSVLVRAGASERPLLRGTGGAAPWIFTGGADGQLVLDGLSVSGRDIVLRGSFSTVRITACTIDPGTAGSGSPPLAKSVDDEVLAPCHVWIEADPTAAAGSTGAIQLLQVDRSILGPIRTRFGGSVETLTVSDSIVQGIATTTGTTYTAADVYDPVLLARALTAKDPLSLELYNRFSTATRTDLADYLTASPTAQRAGLPASVLAGLNDIVDGVSIYSAATAANFLSVDVSQDVLALEAEPTLDAADRKQLNRSLLDESYPVALGRAALAVANATTQLTRVTVLGRTAAHRLSASDSILHEFAAVDDTQDGCVRFSATTVDSAVPRQYESVQIAPSATLFTRDTYGQPGYAQLLEAADTAVIPPPPTNMSAGTSILTGADSGSEMGAFSADLNPIREQGLLVKFAEYMPLGLTPVIVHVT
jgi:hypothetical protein